MKKKKLKVAIVSAVCALFVLLASLTVYAYFTTRVYVYTNEGNKEAFHTGMQLQLLFDKLVPTLDGTEIELPNYAKNGNLLEYNEKVTIDTDAKWGSAENPYVISTVRHLQNLSALQSLGYFDLMYLNENFEDGDYTEGEAEIPYFVVCKPDGTPTVITSTNGDTITIKPIGSAEHPFVGVIGGAFVEEVEDKDGNLVKATATIGSGENEKTTSVSAIHNIKVQTTTNQTDVGLFGYVGFLGEEPKQSDVSAGTAEPQFMGATSSIKNLLISDVQIVVKEPNIAELISDLFAPLWEKYFDEGKYHRYTYTNKEVKDGEHPEETHHIGILAGHVSYANVDKISVYYSKENIKAIDLKGANLTSDNYYSVSGILGMFYNMNCKVENVETGHCVIKMGTGTTSDEVSNAVGSGSGTGGGIYSGNGRGYVTAAEIFTTFNNVDVLGESNNELLWRYKDTFGGNWIEEAILILKKADGSGYTLADGKTEATISSKEITLTNGTKETEYTVTGAGKSWTNFFIREVTESNGGKELNYITPAGGLVYECEMMGNKCHGQLVWKYSAGGNGVWHYGIRVYESVTVDVNGTSGDPVYKLEDGTVVYLVDGTIRTDKTAANATVWQNFFVTKTVTTQVKGEDDKISENKVVSHYMYDAIMKSDWSVTEFERKPLPLIEAYGLNKKTGNMEDLCVEWKMPTAQGDWNSGLYYFYDGVFTFGLSSQNDAVRDTWMNEDTPNIYLGPTDKDGWVINEDKGNRTLVALVKSITSNEQLNEAIKSGKQFYISVQPNESNAYFMSLLTRNKEETEHYRENVGNWWNPVYEDRTEIVVKPGTLTNQTVPLENNLADTLREYYDQGVYTQIPTVPKTGEVKDLPMEGVGLNQLKDPDFWDDYTVLNIGRTSSGLNLSQLKERYNIVPKNVTAENNSNSIKYYYYRADTGAYIGIDFEELVNNQTVCKPLNSNNITVPTYKTYYSYIYYTVKHEMSQTSKGEQSQTIYEKQRTYTFEFFYQPAGKAAPISLGYTKVVIDGVSGGYGTYRIPTFNYGTVYYGQTNFNPTLNNGSLNNDGLENHMNEGVSITFDTEEVTIEPDNWWENTQVVLLQTRDDYGELEFTLTYTDEKGVKQTVDKIPMVNMTANRFQGENGQTEAGGATETAEAVTAAILSERCVSKNLGGNNNYYYYDVATDQYYPSTITKNDFENPPEGTISLKRYPAYTFSNNSTAEANQFYLQFLHQFAIKNYYYGKSGDDFIAWSGTQQQYSALSMAKGHSTEGVLIFEADKPYCYIQYSYDESTPDWSGGAGNSGTAPKTQHTLTKYLGYTYDSATGKVEYTLNDEKMPIYVYVIEGIIDTSSGVNTFVPSDTSYPELPANQYVFWPQTTLKQDGEYTNNGKTPVANSTENATMPQTNDPTYTIVSLADLNWGTADGYKLTDYGLDKKFQMADQSVFGNLIIENGNISSLVASNMMIVPVGSNNISSPIPKGCVAFAVEAEKTQTIRIIVSVPVTDLYRGEDKFIDEMDLLYDYYIGVWKMPALEDNQIVVFNKSNSIEKFELPRSYSFSFEDTPTNLEENGGKHYVNVEYDANGNDIIEENEKYRTYLNGDTFLVAYEFTIDGADTGGGTYIIGSAHGTDLDSGNADSPMEIVHFSVSGTASAGRDGVQGNQLGTIDFVYDDLGGNIITVGTTIPDNQNPLPNESGREDYANYYASQSLLFTDYEQKSSDGYILINQAQVYVRRWLSRSGNEGSYTYKTMITYYVESEDADQKAAIVIENYTDIGDEVELLTQKPTG